MELGDSSHGSSAEALATKVVIISATETVVVADHNSSFFIPLQNTIKHTLFFHKSLSSLKSQLQLGKLANTIGRKAQNPG